MSPAFEKGWYGFLSAAVFYAIVYAIQKLVKEKKRKDFLRSHPGLTEYQIKWDEKRCEWVKK